MTELGMQIDGKEGWHSDITNRLEMSREANELRRNGQFEKALVLYRELSKNEFDPYAAAGLLHCLRKLRLFEEALPLCGEATQKHMELDWYRNEVIWTLIQGKLRTLDESTPIDEVASVAESILVLEPKDPVTKWRIVHRVLKTAKLHKQWNLISRWIERIKPDELSTIPMKDDRGHDGWCDQAIWFNFRIRSGIEVGNKEEAILIAQRASNLFHQQGKFFKRLEALANFRLGRLVEAEGLYNNLDGAGRADWWILHEHAQVLRELGNLPKALTLMCKAALSNKKLVSLVSLFSDIGFLCQEMKLKGDARNHLVLCKYIREEQGWSIPETINSAVVNLDNELAHVYSPVDLKSALAACRKFWLPTAGAQEVSRGPSLRDRRIRRLLKGKVKMGPSERPFAFILSDNRDSYFCFKSDLPDGIPDGAFLQCDAIPSFDKKKNRDSWKAVNIRAD